MSRQQTEKIVHFILFVRIEIGILVFHAPCTNTEQKNFRIKIKIFLESPEQKHSTAMPNKILAG